MSWTEELVKIYDNHSEDAEEMLPVSHSTANAQIEVTISPEGIFQYASPVGDKADSVTVIPVTEDSGARSSGIAPHPLDDKLIYIAGDYKQYYPGEKADNQHYYEAYLQQLKNWCESDYKHKSADAVYTYLSKGTLIHDLLENVLIVDEKTGKLSEKVKILGIDQADAFVRFRVNYVVGEKRTWKDQSLINSFIHYYQSTAKNKQLCYATGEECAVTYKHPSKIRNAGDKAKLISSNDESGFTYRGRFDSKEQAISVGYEFSQKMHNALKWLISKQGIHLGNMILLIWESQLQPLPEIIYPLDDYDDFEDDDEENLPYVPTTGPTYKAKLKSMVWGIDQEASVNDSDHVMVMGLDAATTGRLSISLYEELSKSEFLQNVEKWHWNTAWNRFISKLRMTGVRSFSLYEIAECAFGLEQGDFIKCKEDVRNDAIIRLIPCVTEGRKIPNDIVNNLRNRACRPQAYKKYYNWRKVLECACGMISCQLVQNGIKEKEDTMAINRECKDRSYLYGRLLAVAEAAESFATRDEREADQEKNPKSQDRITNARRYFEMFSNRPYQTWGVIYNRLTPYLNKLPGGTRGFYNSLFEEIMNLFEISEYKDNSRLEPEFLLGYHCQLSDIYKSRKNNNEENENEEDK